MPKMIYSDRFIDDASLIWSDRVMSELFTILKNIEAFPEIGSSNVPGSVKDEFGQNVRKVVVGPFDLVYEFAEESDTVYIHALVHQRKVFWVDRG